MMNLKTLDFANLNKVEEKVRKTYFKKAKAKQEFLEAIRECRKFVADIESRACWKALLFGTIDRLCFDEKLLTKKERRELLNFISSLKESFELDTGISYSPKDLKNFSS